MEEEAELALLDQHLQQTNKLAGRMTTILARLDTRLKRLDRTIEPFGIQPLTREARNIDQALAVLSGEKIRTEVKQQDAVAGLRSEEVVLSRMPEYSTLDEYTKAVDRVLRDIERLDRSELRSAEASIRDLVKLVDQGCRNMVTLFLKFVRDGSSQAADMERMAREGPLPPAKLLPTLPLVTRILSSLAPILSARSHPSLSAPLASARQALLEGYASARREWLATRCITPLLREFDELAEGPLSPGREDDGRKAKARAVVRLLDGLGAAMRGEREVWSQLFGEAGAGVQASPEAGLVDMCTGPSGMIADLLSSQTSLIRKNLATHTFYALELYQALLKAQPRWEETCRELLGAERGRIDGLVADAAGTLRALCLRSFPEMLVDVKSPPPASKGAEGPTVAIADVTYSTVTYLETLPTFESVVYTLLTSLGDRNWLMGAQPASTSSKGSEDDGIVQHFVTDLVVALNAQLESRSRSMKRHVASIYLLNNLAYIRNNLILSNSNSASDILGVAGEDELNRAFRDAKQRYIDAWKGLADLLSDSAPAGSSSRFGGVVGVGSGDRQAAKDNITTFWTRLDEMENISKQYPLSKQDPNLRDRLKQDVRNTVMPALQTFLSKNQKMDKYMRATPEAVEARLAALFR